MTAHNTRIIKDRKNRELIVERILRAPRKLVWEGWTKPENIKQWWGPAGWTATVYEMDVRPGGTWHYCLRPDNNEGQVSWGKALYKEVVEPSRLVYVDSFSDQDGTILEGSEMPTTVKFEELADGKTKLTIRTRFGTVEELDSADTTGMIDGFTETLDRLESTLH